MALDKQRILSELGSVMNQLQSADCGCIGKLFSNPGQRCSGNPLPTCGGCRRGSCQGHGYGAHHNMQGGGESYSMDDGTMGGIHGGCMHGGGMHRGDMHGGGMHEGGKHGGGMHGGGMHGGGMHGGGMHGGGMHGGGMHGGGMHGGGVHGGGMHGGGMHGGGMHGSDMSDAPGGEMNAGSMPGMRGGMPCMGQHAPKLYADTYNYLNQNLMQPLVKEVYDDLRTITPQNTIGHNPLAAKMGLFPANAGNVAMQSNLGDLSGQMPKGGIGVPNTSSPDVMSGQISTGGMGGGSDRNPMNNPNAQMGGMGSHIVNMMSSSGGKSANKTGQGRQLQEPMLIDAPQSPHGQIGVTPLSSGVGQVDMNQGRSNAGMNNMGLGNSGAIMQNPTTQYVAQDTIYPVSSQGKEIAGNMSQGINPGIPQSMPNSNPYGQHSAGITKFNEIFPGVMQGDLNFDPMAIAIQMNPANQKKAAMDTITKLMDGNKGTSMMKPALEGAEVAAAAVSQRNSAQQDHQIAQVLPTSQIGNQQLIQGHQNNTNPETVIPHNQQLVYSATGAPIMNQQLPQQQMQDQQQQMINPGQEVLSDPNAHLQEQPSQKAPVPGQEIREPIYPVDTSKNKPFAIPQYTYNTLGQPIEMLPSNACNQSIGMFGPQTLAGDLGRGYGVKNTMSKTLLAGNRPLGTTASRSQLQHIYRQYKASHSATQHHIRTPVQGASLSEGHLNITLASTPANINPPIQQGHVEKVGGDSLANNPTVQAAKVEQVMPGRVGDVQVANSPQGDSSPEKSPGAMIQRRGRNGLQDMNYTPYRETTGWSFHG